MQGKSSCPASAAAAHSRVAAETASRFHARSTTSSRRWQTASAWRCSRRCRVDILPALKAPAHGEEIRNRLDGRTEAPRCGHRAEARLSRPPRAPGSPQARGVAHNGRSADQQRDRKSTRLNSSHLVISYAVFCLKKKKKTNILPV